MTTNVPSVAVAWVLERLRWMEAEGIWPRGPRYLWTDGFGVVLLVSLHEVTGDRRWLDRAQWVVGEVDRVLGRRRGLRIGEAPDREGQYFHYLTVWMYALHCLGRHDAAARARAVDLVRQVHDPFLLPGRGVWWKMREDLSGPCPGYGLGALDALEGMVVYRLLDARGLAREIRDLEEVVERTWRSLDVEQDLGLGMLLWLTRFSPQEPWAKSLRERALVTLDSMWIDPPGYFCRAPGAPRVRFAFTNFGVSLGLQAVGAWPQRVERLDRYFETYRSGDEYDTSAITHVMACTSRMPGLFLAGAW